ncbi:hypothetical protein JI742_09785 [Piscinibacter sp. Jin2]|uniref:Uncharacterized protein n=1 Tax=Aquariibacter lacus TaxID=2801332 RepID=A0A9X0XE37_9BURK|nr:hypothetical protein [Piscinibacter lacus]MBL0720179.1 hypothetical protein [Piscinibacter lacus]
MSEQFTTFDKTTYEATKQAWSEDAEATLTFPHDVERLLDWALDHAEHKDGHEMAYGIFNADSSVAVGICEVVISRGGTTNTWVKHLRLWLNPKLDAGLFNNETACVSEAVKLFSASLVGVMRLKLEHQASCMKVYGRTRDQLKLLHHVAVTLQSVMTDHDVSVQGRFLVISDKKR